MTVGEEINFFGSLACLAACLAFVGMYTVMGYVTHRRRWWHDEVGRMMVTKALAIAGLMGIVVVFYTLDLDAEWIRGVRGVFSGVVAVMMAYQTYLVYRLQRRGSGGSGDRE